MRAAMPKPFLLFCILLALFYGIVLAGQVLGFFGVFSLLPAALLGGLSAAAVFGLLQRGANGRFLSSLRPHRAELPLSRRYDWLLYVAGLALFLLIAFLPTWRWPHSGVYRDLEWDAGVYHFPKAISLYTSGSVWDFSVPFAEYPYGYESLLAFAMALSGGESLYGPLHAMISAFFLLTLWLIGRRWTRVRDSLLFFSLCMLISSGSLLHTGNPWWIFDTLTWSIGMNDLFLSSFLLAAFLFAPFDRDPPPHPTHRYGLSAVSMLALSTKPNALLIIGPLWLLSGIWHYRSASSPEGIQQPWSWRTPLPYLAIMLPGVLWPLRNLAILGTLFTPKILRLSAGSVINNLTNPYFYRFIPRTFLGVTLILALAILGALWKKRPPRKLALFLGLSYLSLALTPAAAFLKDLQTPTIIRWRFGIPLLSITLFVLLIALEPAVARVLRLLSVRPPLRWAATLGVILVISFSIWQSRGRLKVPDDPTRVLRDQYDHPVGTAGYYSAYDYVRRNITHSIVEVRNGLDFYIYGPGYTNKPAGLRSPPVIGGGVDLAEPDYMLLICTAWWGNERECPANFTSERFRARWRLIYVDREARLYQRRETRPG
jgi:hypothetical protein